MVFNFMDVLSTLGGMGFYSFVLPWLLFLIIIDIILAKGGEPIGIKSNHAAILAAIISFFIVNFVPAGMDIGVYLTNLFGTMSMYIAALLVFILFIGMGGYKLGDVPGGKPAYILVLLLVAILIFNGIGGIPYVDLSTENITFIFVIALIVGVVWILGSEKGEGKPEAGHGKTA